MIKNADNALKTDWIKHGRFLKELENDPSRIIRIRVRQKLLTLAEERRQAEAEKSFANKIAESDADIFDVIVLSAKTPTEVYELIDNGEFLKYFSVSEFIGYRIRAKKKIHALKNIHDNQAQYKHFKDRGKI